MAALRFSRWVTIGVLAAVVLVAVALVFLSERPLEPRAARAMELAAKLDRVLERPREPAVPGVAVFAPVAAADDKDLAFLAGALCDAIVDRLVRQGAVRLTSCASARVAQEAGLTGPQVAHLLGVEHAVEGSLARVARDGADTYRTSISMRRLRDGAVSWRLDGDYDDARLQELIATIAQRVVDGTGSAGQAPGPLAPNVDPKAYAKYLKALQLARRKNPEEMREALKLTDEILQAAPDFSAALYLRLGLLSQLSQYRASHAKDSTPEQSLAQQRALLAEIQALGRRMVALDPGDLRGNILLMNFAFQNRRWVDAFTHSDALMKHVARSPGVLRINARLYLTAGYLQRARDLSLEAARLDPLNAEGYEVLALTHGMLGDDRRMTEFGDIATELGVSRAKLFDAVAAQRRRDWPSFERALTAWVRSGEGSADWVPQFVRGVSDPAQREAAARLLDQHDAQTRTLMAGYFQHYAMLGDYERSLQAVLAHARLPPAAWIEHLWWPELSPVRSRPEFQAAIESLGIAGLWSARGPPDLCRAAEGGRFACR